jgi:hypothetical protein
MITTNDTVILLTPPKNAQAPTIAYKAGVTQFSSLMKKSNLKFSVQKLY